MACAAAVRWCAAGGHRAPARSETSAVSFRFATRFGLAAAAITLAASPSVGQTAASAPSIAAAPQPIYWRQNLFLIPYQWTSTTDPNSADAVWLYVSKDRGTSWQKISEAQPQVLAFNYHAEADGEYWFSIRTLDKHGRSWPDGPMQAELKVIVDTTIPRFGDLSGALGEGNMLNVHWQVADANLDATTCRIDVQAESNGPWQTISLPNSTSTSNGAYEGKAAYQLPSGCRTVSLRAAAFDRAGNRATYQSNINLSSPPGAIAQQAQWPTLISGRGDAKTTTTVNTPLKTAPAAPTHLPPTDGTSGWVSTTAPPVALTMVAPKPPDQPAVPQPWPATSAAGSTSIGFRDSTSGSAGPQVAFGKPQGLHDTAANSPAAAEAGAPSSHLVAFGASPTAEASPNAAPSESHSPFRPLEPFRESSASHPAPTTAATRPTSDDAQTPISSTGPQRSAESNLAWTNGVAPKWVNSRSFALEYQLENISERGVSRVELWGTRDNGQSWRSFAVDDDNRSPIQVTVDDEGLYGFRIVVDGAGTPGGQVPRSGDRPDLWVGVDLHRPQVELTTAAAGKGDLAGRVLLRWRASDEHLDLRPIGLFFSSRPNGPWSTIATNLENSGQYDWQVERHAPSRIYFRVEARDVAGNVAAYQTTDAVTVEFPQPSGRPAGVTPLGPTANDSQAGYR